MKKGLILINAYTNLKHSLDQSLRLKEELENLGIDIDIKRNNFFASYINNKGELKSKLSDYDFCVYLDKDKYISYMLEKCGLRLFNSASSIEACDDKMTTFIKLANNDIPMPITLPGLLCYELKENIKEETLNNIEKTLGYPLIIKTSYGSLGKGVFLIKDRNELLKKAEELKGSYHLYQQFIKESYGKDLRVIVIGGKVEAIMKRESKTDFRANIELGGKGSVYKLDNNLKELCEKCAKILELDYCGIDVLFGKDTYYICEVNSNAFFNGIEKATGINVASLYAKYIYNRIYNK